MYKDLIISVMLFVATSLGTLVDLLINTNIYLDNHMATTQCI